MPTPPSKRRNHQPYCIVYRYLYSTSHSRNQTEHFS